MGQHTVSLQFSPLILLILVHNIEFGRWGVFAHDHDVLVYRSQLLQVILVCSIFVASTFIIFGSSVYSGHHFVVGSSFFVDAVAERGCFTVVEALEEEQFFVGLQQPGRLVR